MTYLKFLQTTLVSTSIFIIGTAPSVAMNDESNKTVIPSKQIQAPTSSSSSIQPDAHGEDDEGPLNTLSVLEKALPVIDTLSGILVSTPSSSSSSSTRSEVVDYDSDEEYQQHQYVSNRFFRRLTRKPELRGIIEDFKQRVKGNHPLVPINLDGLSSRTRILLFRELTTHTLAQPISIHFAFHGKGFKIDLKPSLKQPGDGIINTIGTHKTVFDVLHIYTPEYQKLISKKLVDARRAKPYHLDIPHPILSREDQSIDLEMLNILLDFEVARRLQGTKQEEEASYFAKEIDYWGGYFDYIADAFRKDGTYTGVGAEQEKKAERVVQMYDFFTDFIKNIEENHKTNLMKVLAWADSRKVGFMEGDKNSHDSVPVASAIVGALTLSRSKNPRPLEVFFHAPNAIHAPKDSDFLHGEFNAFQGAPAEGHRAQATMRIIDELRGGENAQNSSREAIHKEYLEIFGGESESDGESYDKELRFF